MGVLVIYFTPTFFAQGKPQFRSVFVINLFLGWTLVGWVAALAWAVYGERETHTQTEQQQADYEAERKHTLMDAPSSAKLFVGAIAVIAIAMLVYTAMYEPIRLR